MATRQYIGARYVPKFVGDWDNQTSYEALSIVLYNNASFTSKKTVPAGVLPTNTNYWVMTGSYNGFIQQIQNDITVLNGRVDVIEPQISGLTNAVGRDTIADNEVVFLTDSYGVDSSTGGLSWLSRMLDVYPNAPHDATGGNGFTTDTTSLGINFLSKLQEVEPGIENKDKIKQIIVVGGTNDANLLSANQITAETLANRMNAFFTHCKTTFPNAIVKVAFCGAHADGIYLGGFQNCTNLFRENTLKASNANYYDDCEPIMKNTGFVNTSDLVHPTQTAGKYIFEAIRSIMNDSQYNFQYRQPVTWDVGSGTDVVYTENYAEASFALYDNGRCLFTPRGGANYNTFFEVRFTSGTSSITWNAGQEKCIGKLWGIPLGSISSAMGSLNDTPIYKEVSCIVGNHTGTVVERGVPIMLRLAGNKVYAKPLANTLSAYNLLIPDFTWDLPMFTY